MSNTQRGFTLIELMIVVAVVAILAGVAYPSYRNQVMRSNRVEARNALLQVQVAQEKFFLQFGRYAGAAELTPLPTASPAGLGIPASTPAGNYTIGLPVGGSATYTAVATAAGAQQNDSDCRTFRIDQTGNKTSTNSSGGTSTSCWK
jgi:type IV pilus assembly protein PilE